MANFTASIRDICLFFYKYGESNPFIFLDKPDMYDSKQQVWYDGHFTDTSVGDIKIFSKPINEVIADVVAHDNDPDYISRYLIEMYSPSKYMTKGYERTSSGGYRYFTVDDCIEATQDYIFDFAYPIFDYVPSVSTSIPNWATPCPVSNKTTYQKYLEKKILKSYYMREIGFETLGQFKLHLNARLNEIMPYYNRLYLTIQNEIINNINPFHDVNYTTIKNFGDKVITDSMESTKNQSLNKIGGESGTGSTTKSGSKNQNSTEDYIDKYSDTPQGSGGVGVGNLENGYLTNARITNTTDNKTNSYGESDSSDYSRNYNEDSSNNRYDSSNKMRNENSRIDSITVEGKRSLKTYSSMLEEYRGTFINIDVQVINQLESLFMGLWE